MGKNQETVMQDIAADTKKRGPSSRVLQEIIRQAPAEHVTVGWLTSTFPRHSFGVIMLCLGLLAMTPVGSTSPASSAPAMVISLISLAYVEEDGLLLSAAFLAAIILIGIGSAAVWGTIVGVALISS